MPWSGFRMHKVPGAGRCSIRYNSLTEGRYTKHKLNSYQNSSKKMNWTTLTHAHSVRLDVLTKRNPNISSAVATVFETHLGTSLWPWSSRYVIESIAWLIRFETSTPWSMLFWRLIFPFDHRFLVVNSIMLSDDFTTSRTTYFNTCSRTYLRSTLQASVVWLAMTMDDILQARA